jgi:uncharacterized protein (TIGR03083 family)
VAAGAAAVVAAVAADLVPEVSAGRFCAEIDASTATIAGLIGEDGLATPVPTCPGWTLRELAVHVGRAHRWAAEITGTRSAEFIPFRSVPDGKFPDEPAERGPWLQAGAARLIDNVRAAGDDLVWTFAGLRPAGFWARRMAHETAVHRADAEIAAGRVPGLAADLAADAISEWLGFMSAPMADGADDPRREALPAGRGMHIHATDGALAGAGEWTLRSEPSGITLELGHAKGDVAIRGPAARLLLVLVRRLPPDDPAVQVFGDPAVLDRWLRGTPF